MISLEDAIKLYVEKFPTQRVVSVLDVGDEWVFNCVDKETGEELDISPTSINKENGEMRIFFPPENKEKLENAVEIEIY